jgi:Tol biopolymer transport system component
MRIGTNPVWTPDGRWIIYSSARAGSNTLWRVPANGGPLQPITTGAGEDMEPAVSADGRKLIYTNVRNSWALMLKDPATGQQRQILERRSAILFPVFSPAGDRIAFFHEPGGDVQVFTVSADGADLRQITNNPGEMNTMPSWSADGSFLYFYCVWPNPSLFKAPAAGGPAVAVANWDWESHGFIREDPSGRSLAYTIQKGFTPDVTLVRDMATGQERRLAGTILIPEWSPDGRTIAGHTVKREILLCPASGDACSTLTKGFRPVWSGDGRAIWFLRGGGVTADLWRIDLATREEKKMDTLGPFRSIDVFFHASRDGRIVWAPFREGRHELWQADLR